MQRVSRRRLVGGVVGLGVGAGAAGRSVRGLARQVTPASPVPAAEGLGFVSFRLRQLSAAELVPEIDKIVIAEFAPVVQALPGYLGYLLGDVLDDPSQNLSVVVLEREADAAGFATAAQEFIAGLDPKYVPTTPLEGDGLLLITATPESGAGTPGAATPVASPAALAGGVAVVRVYTGDVPTDLAAIVPPVQAGLVPLVSGLPGFTGFLVFLTGEGFNTISLFDSEDAARTSTELGADWVQQNLAGEAGGELDVLVITARIAFADLPVLTMQRG